MKVYNLQDDIFTKKYDVSTHLITSGDYYYHTHIYHELFYVIEGWQYLPDVQKVGNFC